LTDVKTDAQTLEQLQNMLKEVHSDEDVDRVKEQFQSVKSSIEKTTVSINNGELSKEEISELVFMREEEKLARDVYLTLDKKYGSEVPVFSNIAKAEETHTDAIKNLLEKYNIEDPVKSDEIGVFTNPELQKLYTQLVEEGEKSLENALNVGVTIEEKDIADLEKAMNETDNSDILTVYSHLKQGSDHHDSAFKHYLEALDDNYTTIDENTDVTLLLDTKNTEDSLL